MVELSATRCSCIAILWVCLVSFAAITLCVASQRVFLLLLLCISLSIQSENFWIHSRIETDFFQIRRIPAKHHRHVACLLGDASDLYSEYIWPGITQWVCRIGYGLDGRCSIPGSGRDFFLFVTSSRPSLGPTQRPIQLISLAPPPGVKMQWHEIYHDLHMVLRLRMYGAITPLSHTSSQHRICLCGPVLS
jgi:hypothetical protein